MSNKQVRCKSYTLLGNDGNHLTLAETLDRSAILISIQQNDEKGRIATVRIDAEQFEALCSFNSRYDGLEVKPSIADAEEQEVECPETKI